MFWANVFSLIFCISQASRRMPSPFEDVKSRHAAEPASALCHTTNHTHTHSDVHRYTPRHSQFSPVRSHLSLYGEGLRLSLPLALVPRPHLQPQAWQRQIWFSGTKRKEIRKFTYPKGCKACDFHETKLPTSPLCHLLEIG